MQVRISLVLAMALIVAMGTIMMVSGAANAAGPKPGTTNRSIELKATKAGKKIAAEAVSGIKAIRAEGLQEFDVDMETVRDATGKSAVPEGTAFRVFITNSAYPGKTFMVGRIVMDDKGEQAIEQSNDRAEIEAGAATPLARGTKPVTKIKTVTVKNAAGQVVLQGSFR